MDKETKFQRGEVKQKIKEAQIKKLKEQIIYRDELIGDAKNALQRLGFQEDIDDPRIIDVKDIIYDH